MFFGFVHSSVFAAFLGFVVVRVLSDLVSTLTIDVLLYRWLLFPTLRIHDLELVLIQVRWRVGKLLFVGIGWARRDVISDSSLAMPKPCGDVWFFPIDGA